MLYNYKCENPECGEIFTVSHGMNEIPKMKCPTCKKKAKKYIGKTAPGVIWNTRKSTVGGRK